MPTPARKIKATSKAAAKSVAEKYFPTKGKAVTEAEAEDKKKAEAEASKYSLDGQTYDPPSTGSRKGIGGRPRKDYDPLVARVLLEEISQGEQSIRAILQSRPGFYPSRATLWKWIANNPQFAAEYRACKVEQIDGFVDDTIYLTDTAEPERASVVGLQVKARQWHAERLQPKKYGSQLNIAQTVQQTNPMTDLLTKMTPEEREQLRSLLTTVSTRANADDTAQRTAKPKQIEGKARK